jgi:hypothetical protein
VSLLAALLGAAAGLGCETDAEPPPSVVSARGVLVTDPNNLDFGAAVVGRISAEKTVKLTNSGRIGVRTPRIEASNPAFLVQGSNCPELLSGLASCEVRVAFNPSLPGKVDASLTFREGAELVKSVALSGVGEAGAVLTVTKSGTGTGAVRSGETPPRIDCGATCEAAYSIEGGAPSITLTATPDLDSEFVKWSDPACVDTGPCTLTLDQSKTVEAEFKKTKAVLTFTYDVEQATARPAVVLRVGATDTPLCDRDCTQTFAVPLDATVEIVPAANTAYRFGGDCVAVNGGRCLLDVKGNRTVKLRASIYNMAFVSSKTYSGNLGGLSGADAQCNQMAQAAELPGTYRAALGSAAAIYARHRAGGYVRTDGNVFAESRAALEAGRVRYPLWLDETRAKQQANVWTGADAGAVVSPNTCGDWTSTAGNGSFGLSHGQSGVVAFAGSSPCSTATHRLICLGADLDTVVPLPAPVATLRKAFVTRAGVSPMGGLAAFDAACQTEANAAGLPMPVRYKALVATTAATAISRFDLTKSVWGLVGEGIPLAATTAAFAAGTLDRGVAFDATGALNVGNVWLGATKFNVVGTQTCNNWADDGAGRSAEAMSTAVVLGTETSRVTCDVRALRLVCLED